MQKGGKPVVGKEVRNMNMNDKINELIKIVKSLNKLVLAIIELAGSITLLVMAIKSIIQTL
ncbi:MAG: hypothetical protein K2J39_10295 [Ruminococcus sp.]|nr:hypothetical protein [Ruminococcus sp.]